ncbi:MAG: site-2 protease family protein, partial [bacterium]|nr:site-2 protease family protein [bacterium]
MFGSLTSLQPHELFAWIIGLLAAVAIHEYAHARAAYALGDSTAADAGRMTLNPFKHLSMWGSLFLLFFGFGWSEPVPVDPRNFRFPRRDSLLTAFAGPASNFLAAAAFGLIIQLLPGSTRLPALAAVIVFVNLLLAFFNLIPVPPLDGASVLPY